MLTDDSAANRVQSNHGFLHHRQNNVQVVNHEIQNHTHVRDARIIGAKAAHFNEHRIFDVLGHLHHRGIKSLNVTNLKNQSFCLSQIDEMFRLIHRGRERFLNQTVDSTRQKKFGDVVMKGSRYGNGHGLAGFCHGVQ